MLSGNTLNDIFNSLIIIIPLLNSAITFHVPAILGVKVSIASPFTILTVLIFAILSLGSIHLNVTLSILFLGIALVVILSPRLIIASDSFIPSYNVNVYLGEH